MASKKKTVKKAPRRAPASKSSARKKPAARKPRSAAAKKPVKKARATPARPAKKVVRAVKKAPRAAKKPVRAASKPKALKRPAHKPATRAANPAAKPAARASSTPIKTKSKRFGKKDLEFFRRLLLNLRDRIIDGISFLAGENLNHSQREATGDLSNYGIHMADHGTDNFDREFALSLVSNEQELLYEIEEAIERIDSGTYGICEQTGRAIEFERLKVLPYARFCIEAQEEREKGRKRFRAFTAGPLPGAAAQDF